MQKYLRQSRRRLRPGATALAVLAAFMLFVWIKFDAAWWAVALILALPTLHVVGDAINVVVLTRKLREVEPGDAARHD